MNQYRIYIIALGMLGAILCGCQQEKAEQKVSLEKATYGGVIPCADCEGIAYRLSIEEENRFIASSVYIGKSDQKFSQAGSWSVRNDTLLELKHENGESRKFKIEEDRLIMLDRKGETISGPMSQMYTLYKVNENQKLEF